MQVKEIKGKGNRMPRWKIFTLVVGGAILIFIMVRSMQEAYALQQDTDAKGKSADKGLVVSLSAEALQGAYASHADSTTKMYKDKTVLISGKISEVDKYHTGEPYIIFEKNREAGNVKIECLFKKESAIDSLSKGENVSVQGTINFMKDVIMIENCQLKK